MTREKFDRRRLAQAVVGTAAVVGAGAIPLDPPRVSAAPPRPHGLAQINATFGTITTSWNGSQWVVNCGGAPARDDHSLTWKHGSWSGNNISATRQYHSSIADLYNLAQSWIQAAVSWEYLTHYGIGGVNCRGKSDAPSQVSGHSWGAAIDTNTALNPLPQTYWNGYGANGVDYGTQLPGIWKSASPYVNFHWGLNWNDPHHFQYFTGY